MSPVPDLYRVHKQRDTGVMAFMPLVTLLLCNHVWLIYAYIVSNIFPLFSVCVFGDIILALYVAIYAKYCPDRAYVMRILVLGSIAFVLVTAYALLVAGGAIRQSRDQLGDVFGYLANKIKVVIETKSSAAIPVLLCGIIFVNSSLWLVNGIVDDDLFIVVPNVVGVTLTAVQLTLYYIYRPSRHISSADTGDSELDVVVDLEMNTTAKMSTPKSPAGDTSTLRVLLRENCSWYYVGRALEEAASKGLVDVVKLLLTVKLRQANVSRALKHAVASEHIEVVKLLADLCSSTELRAAYPNIMTGCNVKAAELLRKTVEGREVEEKWGYFRTQHKTLERMKASHDITRNPDKSVSFCGLFRSW
ncbi:Ankyrin repeat-containing domain [Phytophthora cactorum]|nr:Ankyrin repeat-containing domain [Phytophthora cactorum]